MLTGYFDLHCVGFVLSLGLILWWRLLCGLVYLIT